MEINDPDILVASAKMRLLNCSVRLNQLAELSQLLKHVVIDRIGDLWHELVIPYHLIPDCEDKQSLEDIFERKVKDEEVSELADILSSLFKSSSLFKAEEEELLEIYPYTVWSSIFSSAYCTQRRHYRQFRFCEKSNAFFAASRRFRD